MALRLRYIIFLILIIPSTAFSTATPYYVTQDGAGSKTGLDIGNAWSVLDFYDSANWDTSENPNKIDPGDTVYFSGTLTYGVWTPQGFGGSSGNYVTLDGWEGGTCDPVADHNATTFGSDDNVDLNACPSAAIIDLDSTSVNAVQLKDSSYIILQDFQIRDAKHGVLLWRTTGTQNHVIVRRNYVHDTYDRGFAQQEAYPGYTYITVGGANGDGNFFYNNCEENRTIENSSGPPSSVGAMGDDLVVSYNEIGLDYSNGYASHNLLAIYTGAGQLAEYNTVYYPSADAAISVKESGGHDKIIRFNKIHDAKYAVSISDAYNNVFAKGNYDIYVYGNFAYNMRDVTGYHGYHQIFRVYKYFDNVHFWANVVSLAEGRGLAAMASTTRTQGSVYFYNNTIYKAGQDSSYTYARDRAGFYLDGNGTGLNLYFANNIISESCVTERYSIYNEDVTDYYIKKFGHNIHYNSSGTPQVEWRSAYNGDLMSTLTGNTNWGGSSLVDNPDFVDPDGDDNTDGTVDDDLTLQSVSPAINAGEDLSECFDVTIQGASYHFCHEDCLDPYLSNWASIPPEPHTTKQGTNWTMGAYVYPLAVHTISPGDGETDVPLDKIATFDYSESIDDADIWITKAACSGITPCDGSPDSAANATKQYDLSTLDPGSVYCLEFKANKDATQGVCQQFQFTSASGPPAESPLSGIGRNLNSPLAGKEYNNTSGWSKKSSQQN